MQKFRSVLGENVLIITERKKDIRCCLIFTSFNLYGFNFFLNPKIPSPVSPCVAMAVTKIILELFGFRIVILSLTIIFGHFKGTGE